MNIIIQENLTESIIQIQENLNDVTLVINETLVNTTIAIAEMGIQGERGMPGVAGQNAVLPIKIYQEVPNGLINGINATFITLFSFVSGTIEVFLNGSLQKIVTDYQLVGNNTILLTNSPFLGENILINYIKL